MLSDTRGNDTTRRSAVYRHSSTCEGQKNNDIVAWGSPRRWRSHTSQGHWPPKSDKHRESTRETDPLPVDRVEESAGVTLHTPDMVSTLEEALLPNHPHCTGPGLRWQHHVQDEIERLTAPRCCCDDIRERAAACRHSRYAPAEDVVQTIHSRKVSTGPPGTGKTTTIAAASRIWDLCRCHVWIVAHSNVAVKNIAETLFKKGVDFKLLVSKEFFEEWCV